MTRLSFWSFSSSGWWYQIYFMSSAYQRSMVKSISWGSRNSSASMAKSRESSSTISPKIIMTSRANAQSIFGMRHLWMWRSHSNAWTGCEWATQASKVIITRHQLSNVALVPLSIAWISSKNPNVSHRTNARSYTILKEEDPRLFRTTSNSRSSLANRTKLWNHLWEKCDWRQ